MADIRLTDFVLLQSSFEMWPESPAEAGRLATGQADEGAVVDAELAEASADGDIFVYPVGDFAQLWSSVTREDDVFVLYLRAAIDDEHFPWRLDVLVGARYDVSEETELALDEVEGTLVWLCYPYLRELIASITSRSPAPQYFLPALSKMPHPSVLERGNDG